MPMGKDPMVFRTALWSYTDQEQTLIAIDLFQKFFHTHLVF